MGMMKNERKRRRKEVFVSKGLKKIVFACLSDLSAMFRN